MTARPVPQDRPARSIRGRTATIARATTDPHLYFVNVEGGEHLVEPAYYGGTDALNPSDRVRVTAHPELHQWHIEKVDEPNWFGYSINRTVIQVSDQEDEYFEDDDYVYNSDEYVILGGMRVDTFAQPWFFSLINDDWPIVEDGTLAIARCEFLEIPDSVTAYFRFRHYFIPTGRAGFDGRYVDANDDNTDVGWVELGRSETFKGLGQHDVVFSLTGDVISPNARSWTADPLFVLSEGGFAPERQFYFDNYLLELVVVDSAPDEIDGHRINMLFGNRNYFAVDRPMASDILDEFEGFDGNFVMPEPFVFGEYLCHITGIGANIVLYGQKLTELTPVTVLTDEGVPSLHIWKPLAWLHRPGRLFTPTNTSPIVIGSKVYFPEPQYDYDRDTNIFSQGIAIYSWDGIGTKIKAEDYLVLDPGTDVIVNPDDYYDYSWYNFAVCQLDNDRIGLTYNIRQDHITHPSFFVTTPIFTEIRYVEWTPDGRWSDTTVVSRLDYALFDPDDPSLGTTEELEIVDIIPAYDNGVWILYNYSRNRVTEFTWFGAYPRQNTLYAVYVKDGIVGTPVQLVQSDIPASAATTGTGDYDQFASTKTNQITRRDGIIYVPILGANNVVTFVPFINYHILTFTDEVSPSVAIPFRDLFVDGEYVPITGTDAFPHVSSEEHNYFLHSTILPFPSGFGDKVFEKTDYGSAVPFIADTGPLFVGSFNYMGKGAMHNGKVHAFMQLHNQQSFNGWMLGLVEYTP